MRLKTMLLACACLAVALCVGCSRQAEAPQPEEGPAIEPGPESTVRREPASVPAPVGSVPVREAAPAAAQDPPFRVCALLDPKNGKARCGVIHNETGFSRVLKEGDSFWGYRLAKVEYESETAIFQSGEAEVALRLSKGPAASRAARPPILPAGVAAPGGTNSFRNIDLTKLKPQHFEPEEWETKAGINPNDPKTWPPGYRGPAIERLVRKHPPRKDQVNLPLESARKAGPLGVSRP